MGSIHEELSTRFFRWEMRGRGYQVWPVPVAPEPPYEPFHGHYLPTKPSLDDGQVSTTLSRLAGFTKGLISRPATETAIVPAETKEEPLPHPLERENLAELHIVLPPNLDIRQDHFAEFLASLGHCQEPITFEIIGLNHQISLQLVTHTDDTELVKQRFQTYFPEANIEVQEHSLLRPWAARREADTLIVEFGLARPFMLPLGTVKLDPHLGLIGALSDLGTEDMGLVQIIFQPLRNGWAESTLRAVTDAEGKPFFVNAPELASGAKEKVSAPLFAAVVRVASQSDTERGCLDIARNLASALSVFSDPNGNELIPLKNEGYAFEAHELDVLLRQTRRSGMILNLAELVGLVHLPSSSVRSAKLERHTRKTKAAPSLVQQSKGLLLGDNTHAGRTVPVVLSQEQRVRHIHVIGASGTGKSTLLYNLIRQDIATGAGLALLDPHGDLVDKIMGIIPKERIDDVILLDPSDEEYSIGFNILSAHSDQEKTLLASDLVSVFQRLSSSWGDQMASVLNNAILAFLESKKGGTLADLRRFLLEPTYRNQFLETVTDPDVVYYWRKIFGQLAGNKSLGPVLTRLETFLSRKPLRYMVSQTENRLDFANILNTGKIFLAKLPHGTIGRENAYLLGTLLVSKFQQIAMSRQGQTESNRRPFWLYIDEFHNFITPSMTEILSGARKYKLGLILAHQELRQLQRDSEVASAVLSNTGTRICFRVGDDDARKLADGFATYDSKDLQNLSVGQALCRVERSDHDFNLTVSLPPEVNQAEAEDRARLIVEISRRKYGVPRSEVEAMLRQLVEEIREEPKAKVKPAPEAKPPSPPLPTPMPATPKPPPPDLGRGGAQHQAIQLRLKEKAEALGFRAIIEKPTPDGGSIDLFLSRGGMTLACEIEVTTTIDHEVGNVSKCLKAGYQQVAVVSPDGNRLEKLKIAVESSLGEEKAAKVQYFLPDQFLEYLQTLPKEAELKPEQPKLRRGYKVTTKRIELSPQEMKAREDAAIATISEAMRTKARKTSRSRPK